MCSRIRLTQPLISNHNFLKGTQAPLSQAGVSRVIECAVVLGWYVDWRDALAVGVGQHDTGEERNELGVKSWPPQQLQVSH